MRFNNPDHLSWFTGNSFIAAVRRPLATRQSVRIARLAVVSYFLITERDPLRSSLASSTCPGSFMYVPDLHIDTLKLKARLGLLRLDL